MTSPPLHPPIPDDELHAWVDGRLDADACTALEQRLAHDADAQARAQAWRAQRDGLRQWAGDTPDDAPLPEGLLAAARALEATRARALRRRSRLALAAGVLMAFGAGWLGHGAWNGTAAGAAGAAMAVRQFSSDAALAHAVYVPEVRHPVEVGAAQQDHLVQWLSRRLGRPLKVPQLQPEGFDLVGGRLLPGEGGARAQFMFQDAAGTRLTLYVGVLDTSGGGAGTAFRFEDDDGVPRFYWVDHDFGYALSGALPRRRLLALSESVYAQLSAPAQAGTKPNS
ncbi:MAG: anti-sigma factor [Burkholderiales bacterium]|jgi:anti-sigma factor RsiW|nr:anti-sigma factor [Burkholderiales bacterium]